MVKEKFGGKPRSSTGKWVGPWLPQWCDGEGGPFSRLRAIYDEVQAAPATLRDKREALNASGKYTEQGIREMLRRQATDDIVPAIRRAAAEKVRRFRRQIEERRAAIRPFDHDPADIIDEMRRAEIRTWLRNLPEEQHTTTIRSAVGRDPAIVEVAISVPAVLVGISDETRDDLGRQLIKQRYGDQLVALDQLDEAVSMVQRAFDGATDAGPAGHDFNAEFAPIEDEIDRTSAFKRDTERTVLDLDALIESTKDLGEKRREELIERIRFEGSCADHRAFMNGIEKLKVAA
jgi:hypothetical protein